MLLVYLRIGETNTSFQRALLLFRPVVLFGSLQVPTKKGPCLVRMENILNGVREIRLTLGYDECEARTAIVRRETGEVRYSHDCYCYCRKSYFLSS